MSVYNRVAYLPDGNGRELEEDYRLLEAAQCWCGASKDFGKSVCGMCWERLPSRHREALVEARPGVGFGLSYASARHYLRFGSS